VTTRKYDKKEQSIRRAEPPKRKNRKKKKKHQIHENIRLRALAVGEISKNNYILIKMIHEA